MTDQRLHSSLSKVWVVIPAAGIGQRMESEVPKQYLKILKKTLIEHTLDCFLGHEQVAGVVVALNPDDELWKSLNIKSQSKSVFTVKGGLSRSDSVIQGLKFLKEVESIPASSWVMVHDAARPCLSRIDLDALLAIRAIDCIGGLLASPVIDTMKRALISQDDDDLTLVSHTDSRDNLWHALTPQMFRLGDLQKALEVCHKQDFDVTDECSAIEFIGENPVIVECTQNNIKVTHPSDIALATFLLNLKSENTSGEQA